MFFWFLISTAWSVTAQELAEAMDIPSLDLLSASVSGATASKDKVTDLGVILPGSPPDMAVLSTGRAGSLSTDPGTDFSPANSFQGDLAILTLTLKVPENDVYSCGFDFYFLSAEYPTWVGQQFNDTFQASFSGTAWSGNAAIDSYGNEISVNSVLFAVTDPAALSGTGFSNNGGTGWLTTQVPVEPDDTITLTLTIQDKGDGIIDSTVLLDGFFWSDEDITDPGIQEPPRLAYLEPKSGPTNGGVDSAIVGEAFDEDCLVYFDGSRVLSSFVDEEHFIVTPPAHAEGLIDVDMECGKNQSGTLMGGYTYTDRDGASPPPFILELDPYTVEITGGEEVVIFGAGFHDEMKVIVAQELVSEVHVYNEGTLSFVVPSHSAGPVEVSVLNPDGLSDTRPGALMYVETPIWPPTKTVSSTAQATECACGNNPTNTIVWLLIVAPIVLRRRR
ncbi:MAG: IPT/TIG domain-containing protein [Proteobacteria bacterium]|jgi:hypothetical protein|nr:IPT/TIG domain-containing protein [Pseudomonadota bacterium]